MAMITLHFVLWLYILASLAFTKIRADGDLLQFTARLETIDAEQSKIDLFSKEPKGGGNDYLLHLDAFVPEDDARLTGIVNEEAVFITVVDRSGSMSGKPWQQVQEALIQQVRMVKDFDNIENRVVIFDYEAEEIDVSDYDKAEEKIENVDARGMTDFVLAFAEVEKIIQKLPSGKNVFILFMTDGMDTINREHAIRVKRKELQNVLTEYDGEVVVNVLGFGHHDEAFLDSLTFLGTSDGSYNYVSYKEGPASLKERITQMVESASQNVGRNLQMLVKVENSPGSGFLTDWFGGMTSEVILPAGLKKTNDGRLKIATRKFVKLAKADVLPRFTMQVFKNLKERHNPINAEVVKTEIETLKGESEILAFNLKKLRTGVNFLSTKTGESEEIDSNAIIWYKHIRQTLQEYEKNHEDEEDYIGLLKRLLEATKMFEDILSEDDETERRRKVLSYYGDSSSMTRSAQMGQRCRHGRGVEKNDWVEEGSRSAACMEEQEFLYENVETLTDTVSYSMERSMGHDYEGSPFAYADFDHDEL